jgi:peptidoglycan hydrolase CwlO-like protein
MTIEIALLVSIVSVAFGVYSGMKNLSRNNRRDTVDETSQMTTVMVKLENIADGIHEIKSDVRGMKSEMNSLRERLTIVEQAVKSAHKRLDDMKHEGNHEEI